MSDPHGPVTRRTADGAMAARDDLACHATQAVFGAGPGTAEVMFVGEQPGDQEDLAGEPFVGPAGGVFDRALETVGIDRRWALLIVVLAGLFTVAFTITLLVASWISNRASTSAATMLNLRELRGSQSVLVSFF